MKKFFKYVDISLDKKGLYTPSHTIYIPALYGKAIVQDEITSWIKTPNSVFNFWYIDIQDVSVETAIDELLALWGIHWIKAITTTEAKAMLTANGYVEDPVNGFEISPETTDVDWTIIPSKFLIIE
jgi:hypothetical protein